MMSLRNSVCLVLISLSIGCAAPSPAQDQQSQPFQLNASQSVAVPGEAYVPSYSKPQMVGGTPKVAPLPPPVKKDPPKKIKASVQQNVQQPPPQQRMVQQAPVQGVLPPQFLGRWQVLGSRSNVEALPQYQAGMDSIFSMTTSNVWNIQGSPEQGYMLNTDTGVSTPLMVETQGNTAILRYQHPIKNTVAQEALVMQLGPGGMQFDGLERISIVKQGEPGPRAKVTYKLVGHRQ